MQTDYKVPPEIERIKEQLVKASLPPELRNRVELLVENLVRSSGLPNFLQESETTERYISWVVSLPWDSRTPDNLDLTRASQVLEKNHYGMEKVKERVMEYISVLNLTKGQVRKESSLLCFTGLPGLGKTSVAASIAESLGRRFVRIPFGGLGEVSQIRGLPRYLPSSEPGQIIKGLRRAGCLNPVILLDEIDRVAEISRGAIMGALLELLDPEQNATFSDYFIDYPFSLSEVLFICTANNTRGIANAVLDRLEVIDMPSYTDEEKISIGKNYLFPKVSKLTGLSPDQIVIEDQLWPKIIRPLGYDAGIRTLERTIDAVCRKVARKVVEGKGTRFILNEDNVKEFLPSW